jgi:hypothetical protein
MERVEGSNTKMHRTETADTFRQVSGQSKVQFVLSSSSDAVPAGDFAVSL